MILISGTLSDVKYYAVRVSFQVQGSPHVQSFLRVLNEPVTDEDQAFYVHYLDSVISAILPSQDDDSELYKLLKHTVHLHSKIGREIKSKDCCSNFGKFLTSHAVIVKPIENIGECARFCSLKKQSKFCFLLKFKVCINNNLDSIGLRVLSIQIWQLTIFFAKLEISSLDFSWALYVPSGSDYQILFKKIIALSIIATQFNVRPGNQT